MKPSRDPFSTDIAANKRARAAGKDIITVVTDGVAHRRTENAVMAALCDSGAYVIPSSGVFSRAADEYRSVFDAALDTAYKIRERGRDITQILGAVLLEQGQEDETPTMSTETSSPADATTDYEVAAHAQHA